MHVGVEASRRERPALPRRIDAEPVVGRVHEAVLPTEVRMTYLLVSGKSRPEFLERKVDSLVVS